MFENRYCLSQQQLLAKRVIVGLLNSATFSEFSKGEIVFLCWEQNVVY
jgi:hypothetical protein